MNLWNTVQIVLLFLVGSVLLHILICQITAPSKFMLKGLFIGITATTILAGYFFKLRQLNLVGLYLFLTSWLFYLMAFINLLNSATLKMLARLYSEPQGFLYSEDFKLAFNEAGLRSRLETMDLNGFIKHQEQAILLTPKAKLLLKIIFLLRRVLSIDQVG